MSIDNDVVKEEHEIAAAMVKDDPESPPPPPLKKNKIDEYFSHLPYNIQLQQIYAAVDPLYFQIMHDLTAANSNHRHHLSAFKPVPHCLKETRLRQLGRYGDPPVLQNPERVVPLSDSERFERTFQPNVALAPPLLKKHRYFCRDRKDEVSSSSRESAIKSPVVIKQEKTTTTTITATTSTVVTEEPHSTVSVVRYNSEIELSTDTDDSASETTEKGTDMYKIEEALKTIDQNIRNRVLELVRNMMKEHETLITEKDNKINELEAKILELEKRKIDERQKEEEKEMETTTVVMMNGDADAKDVEEREICSSMEENSMSSRQTSVIASVEQKAIVLTAE